MATLYDMHVHLDLMKGAALPADIAAFSQTVTPGGFVLASEQFEQSEQLRLGLGLHPWWIGKPDASIDEFEALLPRTRFVGEVGLDFGKRATATPDEQMAVFRRIASACAVQGDKVISLHSVRAAEAVLDVLERAGCLDSCVCVFHWFSDASDALSRAVKAGCLFSVNGKMLGTRKGREYVRQIPAKQLLLETDLPYEEDTTYDAVAHRALLEDVLAQVEAIKGALLAADIAARSAAILG